jgi:hypothetical protein
LIELWILLGHRVIADEVTLKLLANLLLLLVTVGMRSKGAELEMVFALH